MSWKVRNDCVHDGFTNHIIGRGGDGCPICACAEKDAELARLRLRDQRGQDVEGMAKAIPHYYRTDTKEGREEIARALAAYLGGK